MQIVHNVGHKRPADFDFAHMDRNRLHEGNEKVTRQRTPANMNANLVNTDYQLGTFDPPLPCKHTRPPPNPNQIKRWASSGLRDWCKHCNALTSPNLVRHGDEMSGLARYKRSSYKNDDYSPTGNHSPAYAHEDSDSSDVEETRQLVCDDENPGGRWIAKRGDRVYNRGDDEFFKPSGGMTTVFNNDTDLPSIERQIDVEMEIASPKAKQVTDSEPMEQEKKEEVFDIYSRPPAWFLNSLHGGNFGGYVVQNQSGGTDFGVGPVPPPYEEMPASDELPPKQRIINSQPTEPRPPNTEVAQRADDEPEFPVFPSLGASKPQAQPRQQPAEEKRGGGPLQSLFHFVKPHKKDRD